jgi:hypothetical protein
MTMGERTSPTPLRLSSTERARLHALLAHYPELATTSDVLRQALTLGTLLMAVQATRPGQPLPYAGYTADDLSALLAPRLLPALAFLHAHGAGIAVLSMVTETSGGGDAAALAQQIDASVADDLAAMGTDFLD